MSLLKVVNLGIRFGGLIAVDDFNLDLEKGELVAIIGPNGAGKTTVFNMLSGIYSPTTGDIMINGSSILGDRPHEVNLKGIARTFQNIRLFDKASVIDNVRMALHRNTDYTVMDMLFRTKKYKLEEALVYERAVELLKLFDMDKYAYRSAMNLPYGEQRKLEIVRALASNPKVMLLDEPAAGMNPAEIESVVRVINEIKVKYDIAILLIEHQMKMVMSIADRIKVLNFGVTIAEGKPMEIQNDPKVIEAYLGGGSAYDFGS